MVERYKFRYDMSKYESITNQPSYIVYKIIDPLMFGKIR